jgi:hypothetical protein
LSLARRLSVWLAAVPMPRARQMSLARSRSAVVVNTARIC